MLLNDTDTWQAFVFVFVIFEWTLRLVMLFIVPKNRRPSSATSWLLLIMIAPLIGTLLFAMFGNPKLNKIRRKNQADVDKLTTKELNQLKHSNMTVFGVPKNSEFAEVSKLVSVLGGLPAMTGNKVSIETNYKKILQLQTEAIENAKEYIHLEYFILVLDKDTEEIFKALESATSRGVKVKSVI